MVAAGNFCLSKLLSPTFSNCGIVIFDHVFCASEVCTWVSFFYDVLNDFFGTLGGHVPVVGPVKSCFSKPNELKGSKTLS